MEKITTEIIAVLVEFSQADGQGRQVQKKIRYTKRRMIDPIHTSAIATNEVTLGRKIERPEEGIPFTRRFIINATVKASTMLTGTFRV